MAEYIEREAVVEMLRKQYCGTWRGVPHYPDEIRTALREVKEIPAADVVEVVRCKNCEHWGAWSENGHTCTREIDWYSVGPDDFCSLGARKGECHGTDCES